MHIDQAISAASKRQLPTLPLSEFPTASPWHGSNKTNRARHHPSVLAFTGQSTILPAEAKRLVRLDAPPQLEVFVEEAARAT